MDFETFENEKKVLQHFSQPEHLGSMTLDELESIYSRAERFLSLTFPGSNQREEASLLVLKFKNELITKRYMECKESYGRCICVIAAFATIALLVWFCCKEVLSALR